MNADAKDSSDPVVDIQPLESDRTGPQYQVQRPEAPTTKSKPTGMLNTLWRWSPAIFMVSYFVFSISIYTLSPKEAVKVLWFLYLSIGTILAGTNLLETYDGLSFLREARKKVAKIAQSGWKIEDELPYVELILHDARGAAHERTRALRETLLYPADRVRITVLPDQGDDIALVNHLCSVQDRQSGQLPEITAIFRATDSPHPHALRHATQRLSSDKKIDVVQSRSVLAWPSGLSIFRALYSSLASFQHDVGYGVALPGRTLTWGLPISHGSAVYGRTATLQEAARSLKGISSRHNGPALAFSLYAQGVKSAYDLSVITYTECPQTLFGCSRLQIQATAEWVAALPYVRLAFTKSKQQIATSEKTNPKPATRTLKQRICILFTLLLSRLGSHAIVQYFSLALALLFTETPQSTADFSRLIFFPYHISIWLIVSGIVCLVGTVAMAHKAASEYAPPAWAFPILVILYPLTVLGQAIVDVYAQAGVFLGAF